MPTNPTLADPKGETPLELRKEKDAILGPVTLQKIISSHIEVGRLEY